MKPSEIRSSAEYSLSSRGSDQVSPWSLPPSGLATSTSYPCSTNSQYGCVSSAHQNPIGQPVCPETAGLEARMRTRFGLSGFSVWIVFCISVLLPFESVRLCLAHGTRKARYSSVRGSRCQIAHQIDLRVACSTPCRESIARLSLSSNGRLD